MLAPMPSASVATAASVKPRLFANVLNAYRMSRQNTVKVRNTPARPALPDRPALTRQTKYHSEDRERPGQPSCNQMVAFLDRAAVVCNLEVAYDSRGNRPHRKNDRAPCVPRACLARADECGRIRDVVRH